jgi:hypothetical protein
MDRGAKQVSWMEEGGGRGGTPSNVEPSRCKTYEEGEPHLQEILKAGITIFVSLQVCQGLGVGLGAQGVMKEGRGGCTILCAQLVCRGGGQGGEADGVEGREEGGRFLYVEPSRCKTYEEGELHLQGRAGQG